MEQILTYVSNLVFKTYEERTVNGVEYLIVNGVPIIEGYLNQAYVPADEFGRWVNDWNGIDLVMRHPDANGGSAKVPSPDVQVLGRFYNAGIDTGRKALTGEYWFNKAELLKTELGRTVYNRILAGKAIETSTGYFAMTVEENGRKVHREIHPDHIAVLPDEIGACSVADGCGVNRNSAMVKNCSQDCSGCPAKQSQKNKENRMSIQEIVANLLGAGKKVTLKKNVDAAGVETVELVPEVTHNADADMLAKLEAIKNDGWLSEIPNQLKELRNLVEALGGIEGVKRLIEQMPTVQLMVDAHQNSEKARRETLTASLVANTALGLTKADLDTLPLPALEALNKANGQSVVNNAGRGFFLDNAQNAQAPEGDGTVAPPSFLLAAKK